LVLALLRGLEVADNSNFFDFLGDLGYEPQNVARMNLRWQHVIKPILPEIAGATVLDLGSHDGRWPYAFAGAGAKSVYGIEGRSDLIAEFSKFPDSDFKDRVTLVEGDFTEAMRELVNNGTHFDIVGCLGVYYHTMHHYLMMLQMAAFKPKIIVIDSEFATKTAPVIIMSKEATHKELNTIALVDGQERAPIGIPSIEAVRSMANSVGYDVEVVDWQVPKGQRKPVGDYFRQESRKRRGTLILRPATGMAEQGDQR
jgi:hypothetical protein